MPGELSVTIAPWGPTQDEIDTIAVNLKKHPRVRAFVDSETDVELLQIRPVYSPPRGAEKADYPQPIRFHATLFDYKKNLTILVVGDVGHLEDIQVDSSPEQPTPTHEEFVRAVELLTSEDSKFREALHQGKYIAVPTMPLLIPDRGQDGKIGRTIPVALHPRVPELPQVVVGVRLHKTEESPIYTYLVADTAVGKSLCGEIEDTRKRTTMRQAGGAWITIHQGDHEIWRFLAIRPQNTGDIALFPPEATGENAATNGAAIELWDVAYCGKPVLGRAHVPVITVKYNENAAGPYRDVGYSESAFDAVGIHRGAGFLECTQQPKTIVETGNDFGSFHGGVAVYADQSEQCVVLVSELETSYYRYDCRWKFYADGMIQSVFAFSAIKNQNTCKRHHHHAYWRLDFDMGAKGNCWVLQPGVDPTPIEVETKMDRAAGTTWAVVNASSNQGYELIPGATGVHDDRSYALPPKRNDKDDVVFAGGDAWIVNYHADRVGNAKHQEIDDGGTVTFRDPANLDQFIAGSSDPDQTLSGHPVIWYGGHCTHDDAEDKLSPHHPPFLHGHAVGFTLKPVELIPVYRADLKRLGLPHLAEGRSETEVLD